MKEDILKFRKLCNILINEKEMTVNKICIESGITWPTMKKLREDDINDIHIMSSVLGQVQNYLHKHCDTIRLAGIIVDPDEVASEPFIEKEIEHGSYAMLEASNRVKESESIKLAGAKVHERMEKELKKKKQTSSKRKAKELSPKVIDIKGSDIHEEAHEDNSGHIKSGKSTIPDYMFEDNKKEPAPDPEIIRPRNLTQIIIFLKTEATKYRDLARDFDICANELLKEKIK